MYKCNWWCCNECTKTLLLFFLVLIIPLATAAPKVPPPAATAASSLLIVSFDAFKPEYLDLGRTPVLNACISNGGLHGAFMRPTFPSKTFPNHFSIASGLHASVHGVLGSAVYDRQRNETLEYGWPLFHQSDRVLPIWTANEAQGGRSASMMWPGGEFDYANRNVSYMRPYNHALRMTDKVDTVMRWMTDAQRPANLVMLYFDEPDYMGHVYSPGSPQTLDMIALTDATVAYIHQQLDARGLANRTNVIYVSDHGMSTVRPAQFINITAALPADHPVRLIGGSPVLQIVPERPEQLASVLRHLRAAAKHFQVYATDTETTPERWHFAANARRIGPIVAVAEEGWAFADDMLATTDYYARAFNVTRTPQTPYGIHGYDNADVAMRAFFVATGPAFRRHAAAGGRRIEGFDNVELYGLFWRLLGWPLKAMPETNGSATMALLWEEILRGNCTELTARNGRSEPLQESLFGKGTELIIGLVVLVVLGSVLVQLTRRSSGVLWSRLPTDPPQQQQQATATSRDTINVTNGNSNSSSESVGSTRSFSSSITSDRTLVV